MVRGNSAGAAAGGIYIVGNDDGPVRLVDCRIEGNTASAGGGIYSLDTTIEMADCDIVGNDAVNGTAGGGIWIDPVALTMERCLVVGNAVHGNSLARGGGIYMNSTPDPHLIQCTVAGNLVTSGSTATYGGGIHANGSFEMTETLVWGNCTDDGGSGEISASGTITITCCNVDTSGVEAGAIDDLMGSFSLDPLYCDPASCQDAPSVAGDYSVDRESPCLPANNECGVQIGALGEGCSSGGLVWNVPGDFDAIQPALDAAASGDTVKVGPGLYEGADNNYLDFAGKNLVLISTHGPMETAVDGGGVRACVRFSTGGETTDAVIEGFTLRNGFNQGGGGAMAFGSGSSPTVRRCVLHGNRSENRGGAVYMNTPSYPCNPVFEDCTIAGNESADPGGGISGQGGSSPAFVRTIIRGNCSEAADGQDYYGTGGTWTFACSAIDDGESYGGAEVDYDPGNMVFADPMFCDPADCAEAPAAAGSYKLQPGSPCLAQASPCGETIGALEDCSGSGIDPTGGIPATPALHPTRPNPFGAEATVRFDLPDVRRVRLEVVDVTGRRVRDLISGRSVAPGRHAVVWDGRDDGGRPVGAGVYFIWMQAGALDQVRRMLLIK
ncbi:MAG: hypothetical protein GF355_13295 [Candidatus Eisenbacteria bacterium]|nr:hypothetical protein [Candidatus Eisenbacteria bacterium]